MTKHARFLHIEQSRGDPAREEGAPASQAADRARLAAVLGAAPPSVPPSGLELDVDPEARAGDGSARDRPDRAEILENAAPQMDAVELPIETEGTRGQPFARCARCGADSSIHALRCDNCAAPLDTAEQRAFNEKLWDARLREQGRERAALAELAATREENRRAALRPLPDPDMPPPPELLEPLGAGDGPFLLEVLGALQKPKWRWIAGALVVALPLFLVTLGGPILNKLGWGVALLLVLSMFPRRLGRQVVEWWTDRVVDRRR